jgi:hypothetical protein
METEARAAPKLGKSLMTVGVYSLLVRGSPSGY